MSFRILHSSELDVVKWNARVKINESDVYNDFEFLNASCLNDWYSFVWGDYEKLLPFYRKKKWGILPYISMPPFIQKFDTRNLSKFEFKSAIEYLKKNNWIVDYSVTNKFEETDFEEKINYILNKKDRHEDELFQNYSSLMKKNILKAKNNLSLIENKDSKKAIDFLKSNELFNKLVLKKHSSNFNQVLKFKDIEISYSEYENRIVAVLASIIYNGVAYLIFPYSNELGRKHQAMSLLISNLILKSSIKKIDFEGSNLTSIANFYEQFGPEKQFYSTLSWRKYGFL